MNRKALEDAFFYPSSWGVGLAMLSKNIINKKFNLPWVVNRLIKKRYINDFGPNAACPIAKSVMRFDSTAWEEYFKFSFVRNPYDFEISDYFWRTRETPGQVNFKEFLSRKLNSDLNDAEGVVPIPETNWPIYSINNDVVLDYVGKYEMLNEHVHAIGERLALPLDIKTVPKVKSGFRKQINVDDFYDDEAK